MESAPLCSGTRVSTVTDAISSFALFAGKPRRWNARNPSSNCARTSSLTDPSSSTTKSILSPRAETILAALPIVVDEQTSQWLLHHPGAELDIDLETMRLTLPTGAALAFAIEPFARHCLLSGLDEFGYLRSKLPDIERFEAARS